MNKVILIGRLTADPESKISANGVNRVTFDIAVNDTYNSKKRTTFIPCVAWNNQANFIQSYLKKGNLVCVNGKIDRRSFISNKTNKNMTIFNVTVENIESLNNKNQNDEQKTKSNVDTQIPFDDLFPESATNNIEISEQKLDNTSNHNTQQDDVEWFDELNNKNNN